MKLFVYKTLFAIIALFLLFELTVSKKIKYLENQINNIHSKENILIVKEKIKDEMKAAINSDTYINKDDAELIIKFIEKIEKDLSISKSQ